jgi:hypothetical protein
MLRATSNIRSSPPVLLNTNPTSHVYNIETQHPQHLNLMFATQQHLQHRDSTSVASKINICNIEKFRPNFETFTWNTRNMSRARMQHDDNDCNMNDKRLHHEDGQLQHAKSIITTPI